MTGGCACGAARIAVLGVPLRAGLCHSMTCRKAYAAVFNPFIVYADEDVVVTGELTSWRSSAAYERPFCPACGARVLWRTPDSGEVEVAVGSFDEVGLFQRQYESWVVTHEPWLTPLDVPQFVRNRP